MNVSNQQENDKRSGRNSITKSPEKQHPIMLSKLNSSIKISDSDGIYKTNDVDSKSVIIKQNDKGSKISEFDQAQRVDNNKS